MSGGRLDCKSSENGVGWYQMSVTDSSMPASRDPTGRPDHRQTTATPNLMSALPHFAVLSELPCPDSPTRRSPRCLRILQHACSDVRESSAIRGADMRCAHLRPTCPPIPSIPPPRINHSAIGRILTSAPSLRRRKPALDPHDHRHQRRSP